QCQQALAAPRSFRNPVRERIAQAVGRADSTVERADEGRSCGEAGAPQISALIIAGSGQIKEPIPAANHRLRSDAISETESRTPVIEVRALLTRVVAAGADELEAAAKIRQTHLRADRI